MVKVKQWLKTTAYKVAPTWANEIDERRWLASQARNLPRLQSRSLEDCVDALINHQTFKATQKRAEILSLLNFLKKMKPRRVCEIGSAWGGTLFLLCQVAARDASLLSIDLGLSNARQLAYRRFASSRQKVTCLAGDSHDDATLRLASKWLGGDLLDFLFIDGDHSLNGVTRDYEIYKQLVRPGGAIAFHDIVPDFKMRFGKPTENDVGDVPVFWARLKAQEGKICEFIEDANQDGYGIGLATLERR